jgi:hypothetical protein
MKAKSKVIMSRLVVTYHGLDGFHEIRRDDRLIAIFTHLAPGGGETSIFMKSSYLKELGMEYSVERYTTWHAPAMDMDSTLQWIDERLP